MTTIQQEFKIPFDMQDADGKFHKIKSRAFDITDKNLTNGRFIDDKGNTVEIKNMGQYVIEEIWKKYKDNIWVSNYGYVAKIDDEQFNNKSEIHLFSGSPEKEIINQFSFVPVDNSDNSMEINLFVKEVGKSLYNMIAETFLLSDQSETVVHHIDNNSYNNSITNLFLIPKDIHNNNGYIHPFSFRKKILPSEEF